ncbi:MAG TPA: PAS domain-containing protein [Terriglobales bacterium]|nr:PAS domain-containing protein [Terriglobales bacterium]
MTLLMNPMVLRMGLLLFAALAAFGLGLFVIRRLRKNLVPEPESLNHAPLAAEGLPVHAYHAVIQQLKQQKYELATQQLSERRKAKASDTLSSTILSNLSCGVLFLNTSGLVRQANSAARKLLGFASPIGLQAADLFRTATLRPENHGSGSESGSESSVEQALAPALAGKSAVRGLVVNYFTRDGESHVLEVTASPVLAEDATLMGTTLVLTDKTDIERIRHDQKVHREISSELALGLRNSLATIAGYAQQLACSRNPELARQLADGIAHEAAQLDRTIGSFLGGARAATTSS